MWPSDLEGMRLCVEYVLINAVVFHLENVVLGRDVRIFPVRD
jgi:hypothetical protein